MALTFFLSSQIWKDEQIGWNPKEYSGIEHIRLPINKIWRPDIELFNAKEARVRIHDQSLAVLHHDGTVVHISPAILTSTCLVDLTYFPSDIQTCFLKFASWTYNGLLVDIEFFDGLEESDVTDYTVNNEFALIEHPAKRNTKVYPCCPKEFYPDLTFTLRFKRIGGVKSLAYIAPIFVLAILCPVVFLLPSSENQRFTLGKSHGL